MKPFDPEGRFTQQWNKTFLICSVVALSLDPLFLYIPIVDGTQKCLYVDQNLAIVLCILRSFADILYVFHIIINFRSMFLSSSSRASGHGEYVDKPHKYPATHYLTFIIDVIAALPLPQFVVLTASLNIVLPIKTISKYKLLQCITFYQYVHRVMQASLFYNKETKNSNFFIKKAWAGAAFNFFLYVLASHVLGALWYFFAIESELRCWRIACKRHTCHSKYFHCGEGRVGDYGFLNTSCHFLERSEIQDLNYNFGLFLDALQSRITETSDFSKKIMYCSWWGLQSLSSLGQGLKASTYHAEILFADFIAGTGLVLLSLLIGNMQKYLQSYSSLTLRKEEMTEKTRETEDLMSHISLPDWLKERVRGHNQRKWETTRGAELDFFVRALPRDLRRDIIRHLLWLSLNRVPMFKGMDDHLLDAMCDRLKAVFYTKDSYVLRKGDLAHEMLFIIHGELVCERDGFSNEVILTEGDFCGEELLTWALDPKIQQRPFSTKTIKTLTDVQGFTLLADELLFIASHFGRSHSRHSKHIYRNVRFSSVAWAAASIIQAAWRRYRKMKHGKILEAKNRLHDTLATGNESATLSLGASIYVSRFTSNALRVLRRNGYEEVPTQPVMPPQSLPSDDGTHIQIKTIDN